MNLHKEFLRLAQHKRKAEYKLLALLPQIYESGIYKQYAHTIEGYAYRFAGLSEGVVRKRLNLERHLIGKPHLQSVISEVGIHKVALIATIATPETEALLAKKLKTLSKPATQQLSKELRGHTDELMTIQLSAETTKLLKQLQKRNDYNNLSSNELIQKLILKELESPRTDATEHSAPPQSPGRTTPAPPRPTKLITTPAQSRYIPVTLKQQLRKAYGRQCAYPSCTHQAAVIHHINRYAGHKSHQNIVPLCKTHHEFAHHGLIKNEKNAPHTWAVQIKATQNIYDNAYLQHKQKLLM